MSTIVQDRSVQSWRQLCCKVGINRYNVLGSVVRRNETFAVVLGEQNTVTLHRRLMNLLLFWCH